MSLLRSMLRRGVGAILIMPEHLLRCHPFVGASHFSVTRADDNEEVPPDGGEEEGGVESETPSSDEPDSGPQPASEYPTDAADREPEPVNDGENTLARLPAAVYDRKAAFVVRDEPDVGFGSFFAKRSLKLSAGGAPANGVAKRSQVTAVAVRERGTPHFSKVLRFLYSTPSSFSESIETWVAVPRSHAHDEKLLFAKTLGQAASDPSADASSPRAVIESTVLRNCCVLTKGQRCADWFIMRQFRVTGTIAGKIMLADNNVRVLLGYPPHPDPAPDETAMLNSLVQSWFSGARSTEAMMRGTANESAVLGAVCNKDFIVAAFECGMVARKDADWLACSPDAVALIDANALGLSDSSEPQLASVEIKTSVAASSLERSLSNTTMDVKTCVVGDADFQNLIPREHCGQILQHAVVLSAEYVVYIAAGETGILYAAVVKVPTAVSEQCLVTLNLGAVQAVSWAHCSDASAPAFADSDSRRVIQERLSFWKVVNTCVKENGPLPPLKLFKHGSQSLYSKTKGGVDGGTQYRAILRSPSSVLNWEQKIVSQTLKNLAVNAFIAWRMRQRSDLLESMDKFGGVDKFRTALNKVQSLGDFIFEVCPELLRHADRIATERDASETPNAETVDTDNATGARLLKLAKQRKANRVDFFNTEDGMTIRLAMQPHLQSFVKKRSTAHCAAQGRRDVEANSCAVHVTFTFAYAWRKISGNRVGQNGTRPDAWRQGDPTRLLAWRSVAVALRILFHAPAQGQRLEAEAAEELLLVELLKLPMRLSLL